MIRFTSKDNCQRICGAQEEIHISWSVNCKIHWTHRTGIEAGRWLSLGQTQRGYFWWRDLCGGSEQSGYVGERGDPELAEVSWSLVGKAVTFEMTPSVKIFKVSPGTQAFTGFIPKQRRIQGRKGLWNNLLVAVCRMDGVGSCRDSRGFGGLSISWQWVRRWWDPSS